MDVTKKEISDRFWLIYYFTVEASAQYNVQYVRVASFRACSASVRVVRVDLEE
jgi:hypothetical protein